MLRVNEGGEMNLRIKLPAAIRVVVRSIALPFALAVGLIAYRGNLDFNSGVMVVGLMVFVIVLASMIMVATPAMSITEKGINFKNWRGRDVFCPWSESLSVEDAKYGSLPVFAIRREQGGKTYKIPKLLFGYAEVKAHIERFAPANHPLQALAAQS